MSYHTVIGDRVILYSYIVRETESKVNVCAKLPNEDFDMQRINVLNWKLNAEAGTVLLTYMMREGLDAPIFDTTFPLVGDTSKLPRPNRSKNWKLMDGDYWWNSKTGKKSYV
jgi:hypothetical protein